MADTTEQPAARAGRDPAELSIATAAGLTLALATLFVCVVPLAGNIAGARDFVVYWATGQQLAQHANPYDPAAMGRIEHAAGLAAGYGVLYMRNPPWALPLALPLGYIGLRAGALLWSLVLLACLGASVRILWLLQGRPGNRLYWLGISFAPALICLFVGQTSLFALLGLTLFLWLYRTRPFLAGVSLWLCALKPHLFLPFGVALLAWIVVSRSYRVLAGAAAALAASCAAAWWMAPAAWANYAQMMRAPGIEKEFIPCLGVALRLWIDPHALWLQWLLPGAGCVWALFYFWSRRRGWDWLKDGGPLMLVSLFAAPYCWLYDQLLAIPALLNAAWRTRSRTALAVLALASILIDAGLIAKIRITSAVFLWTAPFWLAWYIYASAAGKRESNP